MALKFLNKKGWHTGSLRNIENVWKAEQKHDAEQKKLDELRKQIQEERERAEFRQLQEQAGLVPRQERLDFLYDSGLAVGRSDGGGASGSGSGSGFQALDQASSASAPSSAAEKQQSSAPGALFDDKPSSASDAWRKLHSDPLLLIRQREQEALARVKNNPIKMAQIRKSVEEKKKQKDNSHDKKDKKKKHKKHSDSEHVASSEDEKERKSRKHSRYANEEEHRRYRRSDSEDELSDRRERRKNHYEDKYRDQSPSGLSEAKRARSDAQDSTKRNYDRSKHDKYSSEGRRDYDDDRRGRESKSLYDDNYRRGRENKSSYDGDSRRGRENKSSYDNDYRRGKDNKNSNDDDDRRGRENKSSNESNRNDNSNYRRRNAPAPKMSEEERAAKLREMQMDAELHEEQRWKRLKKAEEEDAKEAIRDGVVSGKNFLETARKSVFGAEKGGSSTIEESVRRRTHYLQGRSENEGNAFRR